MVATHLIAAAFCVAVAIPVLLASRSIPLFGYDPMGGRAFPVALAVILLGLAAAKLVVAWQVARATPAGGTAPDLPPARLHREQIAVLATTLVYALVLLFRLADFVWASALYVAASAALGRMSGRSALEGLVVAAAVVAALLALEAFLGMRMIGR
jgi:hypothetical protein